LIKVVAQALPRYSMSRYKLLKDYYNEIERLLDKFWWGENKGERKIHWMS